MFSQEQKLRRKIQIRDINKIRNRIEETKKKIKQKQEEIVKLQTELNVFEKLKYAPGKNALERFFGMLRYVNTKLINDAMNKIDYYKLISIFPFWAAEIRHLGHLFPLEAGLFDLVVVDEASQVNLAEIIPAFYRGKNICILGDHKQLSLAATGLNFALPAAFDQGMWQKYNKTINYQQAKDKYLVVSKASILDFIRNPQTINTIQIPTITLDEHFRSLPNLARWTSSQFYNNDGGLKIMRETPQNMSIKCFQAVKTEGKRQILKTGNKINIIEEEAKKTVEIIKDLTGYNKTPIFKMPSHIKNKSDFTIGVISMFRDQVDYIKNLVANEFPDNQLNAYGINPVMNEGIDTPEGFQGNERDIMIISLAVDMSSKNSRHVQDPPHLNVATSRAKEFTYFVYSEIPNNYAVIHEYLSHINNPPDTWDTTEYKNRESMFEEKVFDFLKQYTRNIKETKNYNITLRNQVEVIHKMRLDFVLYNHDTQKSAAIEVDGRQHFSGQQPDDYTLAHIKRMDILTRAGWRIINTPYYKWYNNGWLCDKNDSAWQNELARIYSEIDTYLL